MRVLCPATPTWCLGCQTAGVQRGPRKDSGKITPPKNCAFGSPYKQKHKPAYMISYIISFCFVLLVISSESIGMFPFLTSSFFGVPFALSCCAWANDKTVARCIFIPKFLGHWKVRWKRGETHPVYFRGTQPRFT